MTTHRSRGTVRALAARGAVRRPGAAPQAHAQRNPSGLPAPRLIRSSPAGAKAGTTVEVIVAGRRPRRAREARLQPPRHQGARSSRRPSPRSTPRTKQAQAGHRPPCPPTCSSSRSPSPPTPPIGQPRRAASSTSGASATPRAFVVGDLTEVAEKEPNNDVEQAQKVELEHHRQRHHRRPTDVDYYVFAGKKGQRVVVSCRRRRIDSRLSPRSRSTTATDTPARGQPQLRRRRRRHRLHRCRRTATIYVRVFQFTHTWQSAACRRRSLLPADASPPPRGSTRSFPAVVEPGKTGPGHRLRPQPARRQARPDGGRSTTCRWRRSTVTSPPRPAQGQQLTSSGTVLPPTAMPRRLRAAGSRTRPARPTRSC